MAWKQSLKRFYCLIIVVILIYATAYFMAIGVKKVKNKFFGKENPEIITATEGIIKN